MILFSMRNAGLHYPGRTKAAFDDLSLTIRRGDCLHITGPSGAGKTSLMRVIAGLQHPTSGQLITLPGRIGMAFAEPRLLAHLTVLDNLLFVAPEASQLAQAMLDTLGLGALCHSPAASLSKGQAQRVALIRALLHRPRLLLLDEALGGLDMPAWQRARDLILARRSADDFALAEISHDPARLIMPRARQIRLT